MFWALPMLASPAQDERQPQFRSAPANQLVNTMKQKDNNLESYFKNQQVSLQWLAFLRALANEMGASADPEDLRQLFFRVGERFAAQGEADFPAVETLPQLQDALNAFWSQLNWGWVELAEVKNHIEIFHHAAPLAGAFGDDALEWSVGLLEGFYERVFKVLGAGDAMTVRSAGGEAQGMDLRFHFGHL